MEKYICDCCNGHIDPATNKCEYCGTQYRLVDGHFIKIEDQDTKVRALTAECFVTDAVLTFNNEAKVADAVFKDIAYQLIDKILPYCEFESYHDVLNKKTTVKARLKVIDPARKGLQIRQGGTE